MDLPETDNLPTEPRSPDFEKIMAAALLAVRQDRMPQELLLELCQTRQNESLRYFTNRLCDPDLDPRDEETITRMLNQAGMTSRLVESMVMLDVQAASMLARRIAPSEPDLDLKIAQCLRSTDVDLVMRSLELLESIGANRRLLTQLCSTLNSGPPKAQSKAALLIQKIDTELAYTRQILEHKDPRVRANALQAIAERADPRGLEFLMQGTTDADNRVRTVASVGLVRLDQPLGMRTLVKMIRDPNPIERRSATWGLSVCGNESAVPLLTHLSRSDDDPRVRELAAAALTNIRGPVEGSVKEK
jgi:HEAT repeat protein